MPADQGLLVVPGAIGGRAVLCTDTVASLTGASTIDVPSHNLESGSFVFCRTDEALYVVDRDSTDAVNSPDVIAAPLGGRYLKVSQAGQAATFPLFTGGTNVTNNASFVFGPDGQGSWPTTGSGNSFVAPRAGVIRRLKFRMIAALGGANSFVGACTLVVWVNNVATTLAIAGGIPGGFNNGLLTADVSPAPAVAAGDLVSFVITSPNEAPTSHTLNNFSIAAEIE